MDKIANLFLWGIFWILVASCSLRSGRYILPKEGDTLDKIAKRYRAPAWKIRAANPDKKLSPGHLAFYRKRDRWIFIPLERGILNTSRTYYEANSYLDSISLSWPVPSVRRISSPFGMRWGRPHQGIDIPARQGTPIVAAASGVVVFSGFMNGYGKTTVIAHQGGVFTVYAHAKGNFTRTGDKVRRKEIIAQVGNTGRSTAPHLHFEVRRNSKAINPVHLGLK